MPSLRQRALDRKKRQDAAIDGTPMKPATPRQPVAKKATKKVPKPVRR